MPTLVLPPRYTVDANALWKTAIAAGWHVERVQGWRVSDAATDDPVLYGEPLFVAAVAEQLGLVPLEPRFDFLTGLPAEYLGRSVRFTSAAAARDHDARAFFKPADDKCFRAGVYGSGRELPEFVAPDSPVLLSDVVAFEVEFRCFVREGVVLASSPYARHGDIAGHDDHWPCSDAERRGLTDFMGRFLGDGRVALPPAVVVDVGVIAGHGWAVVEANPAFGSGIYGCDPRQVLATVQRACVPRAAITAADRPWIVTR